MKRCFRIAALLLAGTSSISCHHARVTGPRPASIEDAIGLASVNHEEGKKLVSGVPATFVVRLHYTLASRNRAVLVLRLEQFSARDSCIGESHAQITERAIPIQNGTGIVEQRLEWPGTGGGALTLESSLLMEETSYAFLTRRFGTEFCMQVQ